MTCDCEYAQLYSSRLIKKTRKSHKCLECGDAIPAGEAARFVKTMLDGNFSQFYICTECLLLIQYLRDQGIDEIACCHGELEEDIESGYLLSDDESEREFAGMGYPKALKGRHCTIAMTVPYIQRLQGKFRLAPGYKSDDLLHRVLSQPPY